MRAFGILLFSLLSAIAGAVPTLCLNGRPWAGKATLPQGAWAEVSVRGMSPGTAVAVREVGTGLVWHEGTAGACRAGLWLLRPGTTELEATFGHNGEMGHQRVTLETLPQKAGVLYPGLLMRMVRCDLKKGLPPAEAFRPPKGAVAADPAFTQEAKAYPPFRTAEGVAAVEGPFVLPNYWHRPLEDLALGKGDKARVFVPDLRRSDVAARVEGVILVERAGTYGFRMETSCTAELAIGRRRCLGTEQFHLPMGAVPFAVTLARKGEAEPAFALQWKRPGSDAWEPVAPERFAHWVPRAADAFYASHTKGHPQRRLEVKPGGDAPAFTGEPPESPDAAAFHTAAGALQRRFCATGDLAAANLLLRWAQAYFTAEWRRYAGMRFLWMQDGRLLGDAEGMRPFLETCLRVPSLQREALRVRVAMLRNTAPVFSRTFFGEDHNGTNDAYGERNNFVGLIWQVASMWDDPMAYDAVRGLYDIHFAHRLSTRDGLERDGTFNFHAANGRQLNMGAYGKDWMHRVIRFRNVGTPWGETCEQYGRLAAYCLAYEWFCYRGAFAFCANGRHNTHEGACPTGHARRLLALPEPCLSGKTRRALEGLIARVERKQGALEGNRFFFRQLLAVHRRADYYVDVKMSSPLVGGVETFAGQNPGNLSFGDGVTTLLRTGEEYRPIHRYNIPDSLWRFRALPGTTQLDEEWGSLNKWKGLDRYRAGGGNRAGGVSDGELGHCGFAFVSHGRNATRARKLFVGLEDGLFVLGGGITGGKPAQEPFTYRSTLNQTAFTGPLTLRAEDGTTAEIPSGTEERHLTYPLTQRFWIEHAGIGYLALPGDKGATLHVRVSVRTPLNRLAPRILDDADADMVAYKAQCEELTAKGRKALVLEIWVDHGIQPKDATVAYFVCMRPEKYPKGVLLQAPPAVVLANDATCQAVKDMASGAIHAFFHQPGTLPCPPRVGVDAPASLMLRPKGRGWALTVQDPVVACTNDAAQHAQAITVSLPGLRKKVAMPGAGDPDDRRRGAPVTVALGAATASQTKGTR